MQRTYPQRTRRPRRRANGRQRGQTAVALQRAPRFTGNEEFIFNRQCWDLTLNNSAGVFSAALPPDAPGSAIPFIDFGTPAPDVGATSYIPFCFRIALDDNVAYPADIANLFREYQIRQCTVKFELLCGDSWSDTTGALLPEIYTAVDPTADVPPAGPAAMMAYVNMQRTVMSQEHSHTVVCRPRVQVVTQYDGGTSSNTIMNDANALWCVTQSVDQANYLGFAGVIRGYATNAGVSPPVRVTCTVVIAARRPR